MAQRSELLALARDELRQLAEEGYDIAHLEKELEAAADHGPEESCAACYAVLDATGLAIRQDFPFEEPSALEAIRAARPEGPRRLPVKLSEEQLWDKILGGWLGRCAGCLLGKPVEGWPAERIRQTLEAIGRYPLDGYWPEAPGLNPELQPGGPPEWRRGKIAAMPRDDDMDYPIVGLIAVEEHGPELTSRDIARTWLARLPYHCVYTAERAAYRNLVNDRWPPESATYRNPYREWIGAQIRADIWGWVSPGQPERAAELAHRDACLSHVKNGIYGEMFFAALLAAAFATDDVDEIIEAGLSEIPRNCRLREAILDAAEWSKSEESFEQTLARIQEKYGSYHRVHTINNAALIIMGLYYGQGDFAKTVCTTVMGGWDTDCTGATAGSIVGVMRGASGLPAEWIEPLNDTLHSAVVGFSRCSISELAKRTYELAKRLAEQQ